VAVLNSSGIPNSPSFKGFHLTDLLMKVILWRKDLSLFFKDVTNLEPRPFQKEFFLEVQGLTCKNIVIVAGRGIGKTLALAVVALWYVLVMSISENRPFKVVILAGSLDQAKICFTYVMDFINNSPFLQKHLGKEPTQREIVFKDGSWIRPLPASEKSIRGHHPDLLIIDEAAEVDEDIIYSALPMTAPSPFARQIFSSTPSEGFSWIENKWEHQIEYPYPDWKFFNWNAESFLPHDQVELLKRMLPANEYCVEIQGLPYKREGKVFRLEDLKECQVKPKPEIDEEPKEEIGEVYAGVDWGYYPAPTVLIIVKKLGEQWKILYSEAFLAQNFEEVHKKIKATCLSYNVITIYTDSTDKGENLRLSAEGLPVAPIAFKGEKATMISNLRMLVEQHRLQFDPLTQQRLIGQMLDYVYDSKRNDDFVDALMLAVKANPITSSSTFDLEALMREIVERKRGPGLPEDKERKKQIGNRLREIGRM